MYLPHSTTENLMWHTGMKNLFHPVRLCACTPCARWKFPSPTPRLHAWCSIKPIFTMLLILCLTKTCVASVMTFILAENWTLQTKHERGRKSRIALAWEQRSSEAQHETWEKPASCKQDWHILLHTIATIMCGFRLVTILL